jgi:DNA gyrase/topoisomerase IV subunit A
MSEDLRLERDQARAERDSLWKAHERLRAEVARLQRMERAVKKHLEFIEKRIDLARRIDNQDAERDLEVERTTLKEVLSGLGPDGRPVGKGVES